MKLPKVGRRGYTERTKTSPVAHLRTVRNHPIDVITSLPAGRMVPIAAVPLHREDSARVKLTLGVQMMETHEMLINPVTVRVMAYLVPHLAFERFQSMDDLARSFEGKPPRDTGSLPVTPYFERQPAKGYGEDAVLKSLGIPRKPGQMTLTAYHESYNLIWNFRAKNRSSDIALRARLDDTLAPAFWDHEQFAHIVTDWDQGAMEGEVFLNVPRTRLPIEGIGMVGAAQTPAQQTTVRQTDKQGLQTLTGWGIKDNAAASAAGTGHLFIKSNPASPTLPDIYAILGSQGVTMTLSGIEQARKVQYFAELKRMYAGHDDDYIIDQLMSGLTVPDQAWKQPMLLADTTTRFGMAQRYATNGGDLTESVVNGVAMVNLNFSAPKCAPGGVIMIVAECLPKQLFERTSDPYLDLATVEDLPDALRDSLRQEPVERVLNGYIDTDHSAPNAVFGYAPMNHKWNYAAPRAGGRFFNPKADAPHRQDRNRIWAMEVKDPVLARSFYVADNVHVKPFVDWMQDPFEVFGEGAGSITGITQFGPSLVESEETYDEVMAEAPKDRIVKPTA